MAGVLSRKCFLGTKLGGLCSPPNPFLLQPISLGTRCPVLCAVQSERPSNTFQQRYGASTSETRTSTSDASDRWGRGSKFSEPPPTRPPLDLERMHGFMPRIGLEGGHEFPGGVMKKKKQKGLSDSQRRLRRKETRIRNLAKREKELKLLPPAPELSPEEERRVREAAQMVVKGMVIIWQYMPVLLYYIPVQVCEHCPELHIGSVGHDVRSCRGVGSETRQSSHVWRPAQLADVLPIPEAYHLWNRTAAPPCHTLAAQWGKVPAIMELCFQAGAEVAGLENAAVHQANGLHSTTRLKLLGVSKRKLVSPEIEDSFKGYPADAVEVIEDAREALGYIEERPPGPHDESRQYQRNPSLSFMFDEFRSFMKGELEAQREEDVRRLLDPKFLKRLHAGRREEEESGREPGLDERAVEGNGKGRAFVAEGGSDEMFEGRSGSTDSGPDLQGEDRIGDAAPTVSYGASASGEGVKQQTEQERVMERLNLEQEAYLARLAGFDTKDGQEQDNNRPQNRGSVSDAEARFPEDDEDVAYGRDPGSGEDSGSEADSDSEEGIGAHFAVEGGPAASLVRDDFSERQLDDFSRGSEQRQPNASAGGDVMHDVTATSAEPSDAGTSSHPADVSAGGGRGFSPVDGLPFGKKLSNRNSAERRAIKKARRELREKRHAELVKGDLTLREVAENVLLARQVVVDNLPETLQWYDTLGCRFCPEMHVGPRGHRIRTCKGMQHPHRKGGHDWRPANQDELFPPMEVYHMDDVNGLPPQHLEIYPLKEFDPEGNFLFRHEPERKWTKWPALVEMCVQAGAQAPEEVLERTNEFERMYIEQGKVMHRDQFTQLYGMLGYEAPHGDEAWSEEGPKKVTKPAYVIPGKEVPSKLGGSRVIRKEGAYFEYQIVDRWVRAGLRYSDIWGLEEEVSENQAGVSGYCIGEDWVSEKEEGVSDNQAGREGVSDDRVGQERLNRDVGLEAAGPRKIMFNGVEFDEVKDGLRNMPRSHYIKLMTKIKERRENEGLRSESDAADSSLEEDGFTSRLESDEAWSERARVAEGRGADRHDDENVKSWQPPHPRVGPKRVT